MRKSSSQQQNLHSSKRRLAENSTHEADTRLCINSTLCAPFQAEKGEYIDSILENVQWLGHKWLKITHSSDYFEELYQLAVKLIKSGKAYVDHQTAAEIKSSRETKIVSPWRERPKEESLYLFDCMRRGLFDEGTATLRMHGDMQHVNPQMWDVVAYRIKFAEHPAVGSKWCIYPSYDFSRQLSERANPLQTQAALMAASSRRTDSFRRCCICVSHFQTA